MPFLSNGTILQGIDPFKMPYLLFVKSISNLFCVPHWKISWKLVKNQFCRLRTCHKGIVLSFLCSFFEVTLGYKFNLKRNSHLIIKWRKTLSKIQTRFCRIFAASLETAVVRYRVFSLNRDHKRFVDTQF